MALAFQLLTAVFVALAAFALSANADTSAVHDGLNEAGQIEPRLYMLGIVEGKVYAMDNSTRRTWAEARDYCVSLGMRLASIKSPAQLEFLRSKDDVLRSESAGFGSYWLNGAVQVRADVYSWMDTGDVVTNYEIGFAGSRAMNLGYNAVPETPMYYLFGLASDTPCHVICESS